MTETPNHPADGDSAPEPTQRIDQPSYIPAYPGPSTPPPAASPTGAPMSGIPSVTPLGPERPRRSGRAAFAASVVAAALLVGAGAGVGGAALWTEVRDEPASSPGGSTTVANVVDQGDTPAPTGSVEEVAAKVLPSVVKINVAGQAGSGSGSGIILTADGRILTNHHVIEVAEGGGTIVVDFSDGSHANATVVGVDPLTDTAVIQAEGVSDLTPATIGSSENLDVGEQVVAIGSPFGLDSTVTAGIVSALGRPVDVGSDASGNVTAYPAIQTDAAINPGNSGGPLVDMTGSVVGINASIRTSGTGLGDEGGSIGLGFAIPIDPVMPIVEEMSEGQTPTHARLGIRVDNVRAATEGGGLTSPDGAQPGALAAQDGAQIVEITDGSAAAEAGLEPGDIITKLDDTHITDADALVATIRSYRPGDEVTVTYLRDGEERTATVALDSDADTATS